VAAPAAATPVEERKEEPADGESPAGGRARPQPSPFEAPPGTPEQRLRYLDRAVFHSALIVAGVALATVVFAVLLWRLRVVLLLLAVSIFLALLLHPVVRFVERRGLRRGVATTIVFLCAVIVVLGVGYLLFHPIYDSANKFAKDLPALVHAAERCARQIGPNGQRGTCKPFTVGWVLEKLHIGNVHQLASKLESVITKLGKPALGVAKTVGSGVIAIGTIAVLTFFILLEAPQMFRTALRWAKPQTSARVLQSAHDVSQAVAGYMLGNFATSVIAGVVVYITLTVLGVPFAAVLAIWVALVDFLPLVGGLLAGIPTVFVAFLHSVPAGIVTLAVFLIYQQVENHVLNPVIMSRTVRLNSLWVLLAILIGADVGAIIGSVLGGLVGALLAVPAASAIQVVAKDLWAHRRGASAPDGLPAAPTGRDPAQPEQRALEVSREKPFEKTGVEGSAEGGGH
jgi:predicted PurR-regulated permease PerM